MARTRKTKDQVLASIDTSMETAITAGVVDHSSQISSWMPEEKAEEVLTAELGAEIEREEQTELERRFDEFKEEHPEGTAGEFAGSLTGEIDAGDVVPVLTDSELDAIAEMIEEESETPPAAQSDGPPASESVELQAASLEEVMAGFGDEEVTDMVFAISEAVTEREEFEAAKKGDGANIQRTLKKVRQQMVTKRAARVLLATNVDPSFINREVHTGSKYNVYALGKLADVIYGVTDGVIANAINLACMRSLFRFRAAEVPFTGEMAKAAASNKVRVEAALRRHLVSHTVSAGTAPTQASSTMQALATLGVVKVEGSSRNPTYVLTDSPLCRKIEEKVTIAA